MSVALIEVVAPSILLLLSFCSDARAASVKKLVKFFSQVFFRVHSVASFPTICVFGCFSIDCWFEGLGLVLIGKLTDSLQNNLAYNGPYGWTNIGSHLNFGM